ncbi:hypothetical protein [Nocardia sp. NRRL S-836]|uniref:hypothetical protein n=1 Tax=Nocardia sp. NRRL S-836 TaxID=1519492 RepID=UPI0006AF6D78|nr:hypothetical protein [Nocardia sp. NRRL S-836]KOV84693.1 hypothetical protein ADL03_15580 [Nocardia sp. NRRL S-836]
MPAAALPQRRAHTDNRATLAAHPTRLDAQLGDAGLIGPYVRLGLELRRGELAAFLTDHDLPEQELR